MTSMVVPPDTTAENNCGRSADVEEELSRLKQEISDVRTAADLASQDEISNLKQKYDDEIASLHRILKEAVADALHTGESERQELRREKQMLECQVHDLRSALHECQQDGLFSSVLKSLKGPGSPGSQSYTDLASPADENDQEPEQAKDPRQSLATHRHPSQREIASMQRKLLLTEKRLKQAEEVLARKQREDSEETNEVLALNSEATNVTEIERLKRSSKGDLQIHVSVLTTQKQVLQEDLEHLRERLMGAQQAFQQAFTEANECRKMLISSASHPQSERNDPHPQEDLPKSGANTDSPSKEDALSASPASTDHLFARLGQLEKLLADSVHLFDANDTAPSTATHSALVTPSTPNERSLPPFLLAAGAAGDTTSRRSSSFVDERTAPSTMVAAKCKGLKGHLRRKSASFDDVKALAAASAGEEHGKVVPAITHDEDAEVVLEPEQDQQSKREASGSEGCEMCANYEQKLQRSHKAELSMQKKIDEMRSECERYRNDYEREQTFRVDVENRMSKLVEDLTQRAETADADCQELKALYKRLTDQTERERKELGAQLSKLASDRETATNHLNKLESLYGQLLGQHRKQADELRNEVISFPSSPQELQEICLNLREELIETKSAREHLEDSLRSEVALLRSQLEAEQHAKEQLEQAFNDEVSQLQVRLSETSGELDNMKRQIGHADQKLEEASTADKAHADEIAELKAEVAHVQLLRDDLADAKKRMSKLQEELNNSEAVQRDFVKLSQSLQVELEKIRQAEHQVRWQHEEDVLVCSGPCRSAFTRAKRKQHCWHCGQIYCTTCLTQTVLSGPQARPTPVCDVCHTILVQNSAPYFAAAPPEGN